MTALTHTGRILALAAVAGGVALIGAGCRTASVKAQNVNTVEPAFPKGSPHYISDRRLITDPALHDTIAIGAVNTAHTRSGLLQVEIQLVNLTDRPQSVEYRYEWTDDNKMQVQTPASRWVLLKLKPHEAMVAPGVAPAPEVVDFVFKMNSRRLTLN